MANPKELRELIDRWFTEGDTAACDALYRFLGEKLFAPEAAVKVLGEGAVDEIRQSVLARLLDRGAQLLPRAASPVAFVQRSFRNALATEVEKWGPRQQRTEEVKAHLELTAPSASIERTEARLDAERALDLAAQLPLKQRMAVLLTTRPDRIAREDWQAVVVNLPPPPPPVPDAALDDEQASRLLYPPKGPEDSKQRYTRVNNFAHAYTRALKTLRALLEEP